MTCTGAMVCVVFFNDAVSLCSSEYLNLRHYPGICLEILRKTTKDLCEARGCLGRLSNLTPPKRKEQASVPIQVHGVMCQRPVNFIVAAGMTSHFSPASYTRGSVFKYRPGDGMSD
jgi:hypothetical protein